MIDVLLTHSFFLHFDPKQKKTMMPYAPLGTLYAASFLESKGLTVQIHDTMLASSEEDIRAAIHKHKPKILAIYDDDFNYLTKMCLTRMRDAAFVMSKIAKEFHISVFMHGSDAADHAEKYLLHGVDAVIVGEGEQTLYEACSAFLRNNKQQLHEIEGIVFKNGDKIVRTDSREVLKTLDQLPLPAWHLVDSEKYRKAWVKRHGYFSVNMVTTRGCPYHCNWCAKPIYGQVYNSRSPENVVEEMLLLQSSLHPDHIWFADDIFGLKPGWVRRFAELVNERHVKIPFKIQSRADLLLRDNTIEALASAGCTEVWVGAESGSQKILDAMEKGISVHQIYEARKKLKQYGIRTSLFLQFGYRGETWEDIQSTIKMVKDLQPDDVGISVSYPLPGTKFYEIVKTEMGEKKNWTDSDDLALMYHGTYSPIFYKQLHRYVHTIFRSTQGFNFVKEVFGLQGKITKQKIRRIMLLAYYIPALAVNRIRLYQLAKTNLGRINNYAN